MNQIKTTLFKKTKTGAINQWSIYVNEDLVITQWGQVDGKLQEESYKAIGKNQGRSNATTGSSQAISEALSKWQRQIDKGYTENPSGISEVCLPMKVKDYWSNTKNVSLPCYAEPKYDGVNCLFVRESKDSVRFISRGGKDYPVIEHLIKPLISWFDQTGETELNGELYIHGEHLQDIQSAVKKYNELTPKLTVRIFDISSNTTDGYRDRLQHMKYITSEIPLVNPPVCDVFHTHESLECYHDDMASLGYEGIVIRNPEGLYQHNVRSSDVFKMKKAKDSEFKIVDYTIDKKGHVVFTLETPEGKYFKAKNKGSDSVRKSIVELADSWIGKWMKVEFENYSKDMIPLKPVAIWIRECDDKGEVLE